MHDLLKSVKKMNMNSSSVKVIIAKPYSRFFLYRAESELKNENNIPFKP